MMDRLSHIIAVKPDSQWLDKIPYIHFPSQWSVQIIPPFNGAVVRFRVKNKKGATVSVYLDCYEALGFFGGPHWEIYPDKDGENSRFAMDDVEGLLEAITKVES